MTVTTAESVVNPIIMQIPNLVENGICSLQNTLIGTMANTKSVMAVNAPTQYEKPSNTAGSQHVPSIEVFQSFSVGLHCAKIRMTLIMAKMTMKSPN